MRFIDLAAHGGCSKKVPAQELRELLSQLETVGAGSKLAMISRDFPDSGVYCANGHVLLSTVDIVLPMTLSPTDFGKITVCHVLNDIYASGGLPIFALCILGLRHGMSAASEASVEVMRAAVEQLSAEAVVLVGGHTMASQEDFYLGFAAVGTLIGATSFSHVGALPGDVLILTKPLGTSISTIRWKLEQASEADHGDVINGMRQSNRAATQYLAQHSVHACTDITGYGFMGHLYNILHASEVAARIEVTRIPCYGSLSSIAHPSQSRQFLHNLSYVRQHLTFSVKPNELLETLLFDSQVSGGLLISVDPNSAGTIVDGIRKLGYSPSVVGVVCEGAPGAIELV